MSSNNSVLLFLIVGQNEPLYEAEIHKRGAPGNSDAVARQNYFVTHSALDLVEKAQWVTSNVSLLILVSILVWFVRDLVDFDWGRVRRGLDITLQLHHYTKTFVFDHPLFFHVICFVRTFTMICNLIDCYLILSSHLLFFPTFSLLFWMVL
jgi:Sedlin, N-terminal conserved region